MKKKLIISEQKLEISGFCSKSLEEFSEMKLSSLLNWDIIIFAFDFMTEEKAKYINLSAGTGVGVKVVCPDVQCCMTFFKQLLNINNSKNNIEFLPAVYNKSEDGEIYILPN